MLAGALLCLTAIPQGQTAPKPPKSTYDAKRDVTTYSTGDVRTAGYSGYGASFEFPGKIFSKPSSVSMGFGALRLSSGPDHDQEALHWNGVDSISIVFDSQSLIFPAKHEYKLSTNRTVTMFLGRGLEESLAITMTPDQLKQIASSDTIQVQLGKDKQDIKGKSLIPLKKLAATIPPAVPLKNLSASAVFPGSSDRSQ